MTKATKLAWAATFFMLACGPSGGGEDEPEGETGEAQAEAAHGGGEEPSRQLAKNQTYRQVRAGTRLVLTYDEENNAFSGLVQNVGAEPLARVRVEVHLSNGVELGPTWPADLAGGESVVVHLPGSEEPFETWSAHAEVGGAEGERHDGDGEHGEEHGGGEESGDGKSPGEHGGKG